MSFESARAFYESALQGFWALLVVPALWLLLRALRGRPRRPGVEPPAVGFVDLWAIAFAVETILDLLATGPLARALPPPWPTALSLLFVLLGDLRVLLLLAYLAGGRNALRPALRKAALLTPLVPVVAFVAEAALATALGALPGQVLWLIHEVAFLALLLFLRTRIAVREPDAAHPRARYLRAILGYVVVYYALWAACDVGILLNFDAAYAVRAIPNQLYYGFFVPFAHARFFSRSYPPASVASSVSARSESVPGRPRGSETRQASPWSKRRRMRSSRLSRS